MQNRPRRLRRSQRLRDLVADAEAHDQAQFPADSRLMAPIPTPRKNVFCVGRNYAEHIAEALLGLAFCGPVVPGRRHHLRLGPQRRGIGIVRKRFHHRGHGVGEPRSREESVRAGPA